jgi:hypothetical protein
MIQLRQLERFIGSIRRWCANGFMQSWQIALFLILISVPQIVVVAYLQNA